MSGPAHRIPAGSTGFARVVNLSDAVFAIAMTLLVLTIEVPTATHPIAGQLRAQVPQLAAFVLSFALVSYFWWVHHRLFSLLRHLGPGLMVGNLVLLGAVALVPYPTALLGLDEPGATVVVAYTGVLGVIAAAFVVLLVTARRTAAFEHPVPDRLWPWLVASWAASAAVVLAAMLVARWLPRTALGVLLATWPVEALIARLAPGDLTPWS